MSSQMQKTQLDKVCGHKRGFWANPFVVLILLLLLLLITVSTLLILSDLGILILTWSNNLSTVFVGIILPALAIIVTLAQWLHSLSSQKEKTSSPLSHDHSGSVESPTNSSGLLKPPPADEKMHAGIFVQAISSPTTQAHNRPSIDWGEAPDTGQFYGRERELLEVKKWAGEDHCKVIGVVGMGGIGKTSLVVKAVDQVQQDFASIFWRSVQNAPPLQHLLQSCIQFLSDQKQATLPEGIDEQILLLIDYLRKKRCLLVLDNYESLLQSENQTGLYRDGYESYGTLIKRIGDMKHQSCLIITSREKPREIALMEGNIYGAPQCQVKNVRVFKRILLS